MGKSEKLLEGAEAHLDSGEEVLHSVVGTYDAVVNGKAHPRAGLLVATDRRIIFFSKRLTGFDFESFPYENISSFESGKRMLGGNVTFFASGNKVTIKNAKLDGLGPLVEYARSRMGRAAGASAPDLADQIRKLSTLRDDGILSDEEFEAKKAELLSKM